MEARSDIDAQIVRYTELLEAKDKIEPSSG